MQHSVHDVGNTAGHARGDIALLVGIGDSYRLLGAPDAVEAIEQPFPGSGSPGAEYGLEVGLGQVADATEHARRPLASQTQLAQCIVGVRLSGQAVEVLVAGLIHRRGPLTLQPLPRLLDQPQDVVVGPADLREQPA
ncbi:hypothetical protein D3C78_559690 [compost metagenome]